MHLESNHFVSCLLCFCLRGWREVNKALVVVWMWLPVAAEATWYSWCQIIPSGGTLYQPVAMVTSQGQVLTQALPPGTIQIQNSQVKESDCRMIWRTHLLSVSALTTSSRICYYKKHLLTSHRNPRGLCLNTGLLLIDKMEILMNFRAFIWSCQAWLPIRVM